MESLSYGFSTTETAISTAPVVTSTALVGEETVTFTGGLGNPGTPAVTPPPPPPPPPPPEFGVEPGWTDGAYHVGFPNQDCGPNHCVPTAMSNSLQFFNDKHKLGIKDELISIEALAEVLDTTPTSGTAPYDENAKLTYIEKKQAYLKKEGIPVRTKYVFEIEDVIEAVRNDMDVEIWLLKPINPEKPDAPRDGHFVAIDSIWKYDDDKYGFSIVHDIDQGNDGGTDLPPFSGPPVSRVCSPFVCHHSAA